MAGVLPGWCQLDASCVRACCYLRAIRMLVCCESGASHVHGTSVRRLPPGPAWSPAPAHAMEDETAAPHAGRPAGRDAGQARPPVGLPCRWPGQGAERGAAGRRPRGGLRPLRRADSALCWLACAVPKTDPGAADMGGRRPERKPAAGGPHARPPAQATAPQVRETPTGARRPAARPARPAMWRGRPRDASMRRGRRSPAAGGGQTKRSSSLRKRPALIARA